MSASIGATTAATAAVTARNDDQRIVRTAQQFESVFVRQMFAAMRSTVSSDGILEGGEGEEMFTTLFDEHIADEAPAQMGDAFTQEIMTQFRQRRPEEGAEISK